MKNKTIILIFLLTICASLISVYGYERVINKKDNDKLIVTSAEIFNNKIELIDGQYIYDIFLKEGEIKDLSGGCVQPFVFTTNQNDTYGTSSIYYSDDLKEAKIKIGLKRKDNSNVQTFAYEFSVYFEQAIKVSDSCKPR